MNRMNYITQEIAILAFQEMAEGNPDKPVKEIVAEAERLADVSAKFGCLYEAGVNEKEDVLECVAGILEGEEIGCWSAEEAIEKIFSVVKKEYLKQVAERSRV